VREALDCIPSIGKKKKKKILMYGSWRQDGNPIRHDNDNFPSVKRRQKRQSLCANPPRETKLTAQSPGLAASGCRIPAAGVLWSFVRCVTKPGMYLKW
jgi:hypothetical protein